MSWVLFLELLRKQALGAVSGRFLAAMLVFICWVGLTASMGSLGWPIDIAAALAIPWLFYRAVFCDFPPAG